MVKTALLTTQEAALRLGLSPRSVRLYCRRGDLPAQLLGGQWLIREADALRFTPPPPGRRWPAKTGRK